MTTINKNSNLNKVFKNKNTLSDSVKVLAELTRKDIERSFNIDDSNNTEIYYSNRYGWFLRRNFE